MNAGSLIVVLDDKPIEDVKGLMKILSEYAPRVGAELEHLFAYRTVNTILQKESPMRPIS